MEDRPETPAIGSRSRAWRPLLKWTLLGLLLFFVGRHAYRLWRQDDFRSVDLQVPWLILAGAVYLLGWLPSVWFWWELMRRVGGDVSWRSTVRAYYCGHLGKYIPGKAMVLVIRAALVKDHGCRPGLAGLTAAYETVVMMGVGLAVGLALVGGMAAELLRNFVPRAGDLLLTRPALLPMAVLAAAVLALPVLSRVLSRSALFMIGRGESANDPVRLSIPLLATGMAAFVLSWAIHGLSLGCAVRAVSGGNFELNMWPQWMGAVALATSLGFAALVAPGGIGIREAVLMEVLRLQPGITDQQAVAAAVLLRLVWLAAEILAAAVLYYGLASASVKK